MSHNTSTIHYSNQPPDFSIKLFNHQLASIYHMEQLESNPIILSETNEIKDTKIGINADITGYGKTLSMIGLIARDKMPWDLNFPFVFETVTSEAKGRIKNYNIKRFDRLKTTLVLVSNNIVNQWVSELSKTKLTYRSIVNRKDFDNDVEVQDYDVVIVVPSLYNRLIHYYSGYAWKRLIFDEPGFLKISNMEEMYAGFYWFVTATPHAIYSHYKNRSYKSGFMKDLFASNNDFNKFCENIIIANDPEFIKSSFEMPITNHHHYQCFQPMYNVVLNFVSSSVATMISAGNIEGAIMAMGGTKCSNIVDVIKKQKQYQYSELMKKLDDEDEEASGNDLLKKKMSHLQEQIKDLDSKFESLLKDNCHICCDSLTKPVLEPNCHNIFCGNCLLQWLQQKNSCPLCRNKVDPSKLVYIDSSSSSSPTVSSSEKKSRVTKIDKTVELIKSNPQGKFLIYSDQNQTFLPLSNAFYENDICFVQMKGNIRSREKNLEMFKSGEVPVIFLNSNSDSAGLNLTESTDIILYHQMPDSTENQIIGRANRIGRKYPLNVHHLHIQD
jgi:SNF2 family DNA or RNA helicase